VSCVLLCCLISGHFFYCLVIINNRAESLVRMVSTSSYLWTASNSPYEGLKYFHTDSFYMFLNLSVPIITSVRRALKQNKKRYKIENSRNLYRATFRKATHGGTHLWIICSPRITFPQFICLVKLPLIKLCSEKSRVFFLIFWLSVITDAPFRTSLDRKSWCPTS
jgi:hypothetical protein